MNDLRWNIYYISLVNVVYTFRYNWWITYYIFVCVEKQWLFRTQSFCYKIGIIFETIMKIIWVYEFELSWKRIVDNKTYFHWKECYIYNSMNYLFDLFPVFLETKKDAGRLLFREKKVRFLSFSFFESPFLFSYDFPPLQLKWNWRKIIWNNPWHLCTFQAEQKADAHI